MSHVETIKQQFIDLGILKEACKVLGLEFYENQSTYRWFGRFVGDAPLPEGFTKEELGHCLHAIGIKDNDYAYQIGVVKSKTDDGYVLLYDNWREGKGLEQVIGKKANRLAQEYSIQACIADFRRKGRRVIREEKENGHVRLRAIGR